MQRQGDKDRETKTGIKDRDKDIKTKTERHVQKCKGRETKAVRQIQ